MRGRRVIAVVAALTALASPAGAAAYTNAQIPGLQVALSAAGFYRGQIDGVAGPQTARAIRAFQRKAGLAVDGIAGLRTRKALGPLGRPLFGARTIRRGHVGWDVAVLQFLLVRNGCTLSAVDGRFGAGTERALRHFQRRAGLAVDGIAGRVTFAALGAQKTLAARPKPRVKRYRVRPGDSLTAIAVRHRTSVDALARTNRLDPARVLLIGTVLRLPAGASAPQRSAAPMQPFPVRARLDYWAAQYGIQPSLLRALAWMESGYQPEAVSSIGAFGVMQLTEDTWDFVETVLIGRAVPRTVDGNIRIGAAFLEHLLELFEGDVRLALGAYYQGARAVRERGLLPESEAFVADVLALSERM